MRSFKKIYIAMIGPDPEGLGGISRVVKIWIQNGLLEQTNSEYIATATDKKTNKIMYLIRAIIKYIYILHKCKRVYVHTSSDNSFWRKAIFIVFAIIFRKQITLHIHPTHFIDFHKKQKNVSRKLCNGILNRINEYVVLTENVKKYIQNVFPESNVYVLPNAVIMQSRLNGYHWNRDKWTILFLGWHIREKGVYELVDAMSCLKKKKLPVRLRMFGTKETEKLIRYVNKKKIDDVVYVNGWINDEEKMIELKKCAGLILPSHSEGIPNVILEAMASHTPIIATRVGGLKEILRDNENCLEVEVGNPVDIAEKIEILLSNPNIGKMISRCAYNDALDYFDIEVIKKKFSEIIKITSNGGKYKITEKI